MQVFKFGGASVKDAKSFQNIRVILEHFRNQRLLIVISAMGKTTNELEKVAEYYFYGNENLNGTINGIKQYHHKIISELFNEHTHPVYTDFESVFMQLDAVLKSSSSGDFDREYDRIVPFGEMLSSVILNHFLNYKGFQSKWFDITSVLETDEEFRNAKVNWEKTSANIRRDLFPVISENVITVLQGFIGKTTDGNLVTLGREGSDYTAAIVAFCTDAESVTIWKDVPGVLNADPKYFKNTKVINELSYSDAVELAYYGASVIHPKTIKPLENKNIPLYVKSFLSPLSEGTKIHKTEIKLPVPVYIYKVNQALISIFPKDFSFIAEENLRDIFSVFTEHKAAINLMQNTAISFSVVTDYNENKLRKLVEKFKEQFRVKYNLGLELITIRHYDQHTIDENTKGKKILLEQKTRFTAQLVVRDEANVN